MSIARTRRPLDETFAQVNEDHREGKDKLTITRATARAIYYVIWDLLHADEPREHDEADLERLERVLTNTSSIGWPEAADES